MENVSKEAYEFAKQLEKLNGDDRLLVAMKIAQMMENKK